VELLKSVGTVVLALLACGRGTSEKGKAAEDLPPSAPPAKAAREYVVGAVPLELGEGNDRAAKITVWPADGAAALELPSGTRVEHVADLGRPPPSGAPERGMWRVRVMSTGLVAYARSYQIQAAR
jgi:hypothetical protein